MRRFIVAPETLREFVAVAVFWFVAYMIVGVLAIVLTGR
jgi:hypothetical protein